jgi:ABC-type phosphate transport system auxiliary subunit
MKQHKTLEEKQAKQIQQQFGRKRAQHKKRALDYFSMANFVDQAFGIEKDELEKPVSSNGYHTSSSTTPQVNIQIYLTKKQQFYYRLYHHHSIN